MRHDAVTMITKRQNSGLSAIEMIPFLSLVVLILELPDIQE